MVENHGACVIVGDSQCTKKRIDLIIQMYLDLIKE